MKTKLPNWLRWALVLPAAVGAWIAIQLINALCTVTLPWFGNYPVQFFNSSVCGPCFILAGAFTAPCHRVFVAIALTVLCVFLTGNAVLICLLAMGLHSFQSWWILICGAWGIVTTVWACFGLVEQQKAEAVQQVQDKMDQSAQAEA